MSVTPGNRRNRQNLTNIQTKQRDLIRAEQDLYNCGVIGQACFAAGTRLLSPTGPKAIEDFAVGDAITSRHEFEPGGALEVKTVEAVFRRTAPILAYDSPMQYKYRSPRRNNRRPSVIGGA